MSKGEVMKEVIYDVKFLEASQVPTDVRQCSKVATKELPGGCDLLRKRRTVIFCETCEEDYCNKPGDPKNSSTSLPPTSEMVLLAIVFRLLFCLNYRS